uniref:Uncharacterized protein n=1 Tax=Oryza brachyantha TaxID=4533 RepID=J3L8U4_ORYBR
MKPDINICIFFFLHFVPERSTCFALCKTATANTKSCFSLSDEQLAIDQSFNQPCADDD